ncbi:hypothetical protein OESDEN_16132 [Oesophagostomum dentatum]|uniref:Uncharacterized protein n=1 Tax=Oesophagostomum dentatum TaxID=61180 RepID=A0A0B1SFU3_OESDE|nr:hypothetical protein OESDEN_16132 [Oesophagostomum dentatum]
MLFNMTEEEQQNVDPIILDELIELLQSIKQRKQTDAALMPSDSSLSLITLPDDIPPVKTQRAGFRRVSARTSSSADLQANQEVMLINETVQRHEVASPYQRPSSSRVLRQRNPVSKTLGGDSPFFPIRGSPFF